MFLVSLYTLRIWVVKLERRRYMHWKKSIFIVSLAKSNIMCNSIIKLKCLFNSIAMGHIIRVQHLIRTIMYYHDNHKHFFFKNIDWNKKKIMILTSLHFLASIFFSTNKFIMLQWLFNWMKFSLLLNSFFFLLFYFRF